MGAKQTRSPLSTERKRLAKAIRTHPYFEALYASDPDFHNRWFTYQLDRQGQTGKASIPDTEIVASLRVCLGKLQAAQDANLV